MTVAADKAQGSGRRLRWWRVAPWVGAGALWLLPLVAMQVRAEMDWSVFDFGLWAVMLFGACGLFELGVRLSGSTAYRAGFAVALIGGFLLVWINLAVGIIGSEDNPANLMFAGVLFIGVVGALLGRLQPAGMMRTLAVMGAAQLLAGAVALAAGWGSTGENWPQAVVVLSLFFAALWFGSAALFRESARNRPTADAPA